MDLPDFGKRAQVLDAKQTRPFPVIERVWLREATLEEDRVDRDRFKVDSSADRIDVDWIRINTLVRTGLYIAYERLIFWALDEHYIAYEWLSFWALV